MPTWIEKSLEEAACVLEKAGKSELAAILARLRNEPEIQDLRLYRSLRVAELADALYECESLDQLFDLIGKIATAFGASHCTIHCIKEKPTAFFSTKVLTTFPRQWVAQYIERRYSAIDPLLARCRAGTGTFFWDEVVVKDPITKHFIKAGIQAGIGPSGVSFVQVASNGSTVGVNLCSTSDHRTFRRAFESQLADFEEIAAVMIASFSDLACDRNSAPFNPTDDQLKVLKAIASGRALTEVENFRFVYGSFKTIEKSILKSFGAKTLAQATAMAANLGLLEDLPYFEEDVFGTQCEQPAPELCAAVA